MPAVLTVAVQAERVDGKLGALGWRSPVAGNFTVEADRSLVGALLGKYVEHHTFVEAKVLAPLRDCATFADYIQLDLPDGLRLQTFHQKNKSPGASAPLSVVATLC